MKKTMKNKGKKLKTIPLGFTLVELLAVIVILAIVLIIAVPGVLSIINKTKADAYDRQVDMIKEAAKLYVTSNGPEINWTPDSSNTSAYVMEDQLKSKGYLDNKILDPRTKQEMADFAVKVTKQSSNNHINYEVIFDYSDLGATDASCFTFDKAEHKITGYRTDCPKEVHIPSKIDGVEVYAVKDRTFIDQNLTSVIFPKTLKSIEEYAFTTNKLTDLTIPKSVNSIGRAAFNNNLLPDSKAYIFARNQDGSIDNTMLVSYAGNTTYNPTIPSTVKILSNNCFQYVGLTSIIIPEGITQINHGAFANNGLTNVTIPNTVTAIGTIAFTSNLLPDDQAFIYARNRDGSENKTVLIGYGGAKLDNVRIPDNVVKINDSAISYTGVRTVIIPPNVMELGTMIFSHSAIQKVTVQGKSSIDDFTSVANNPWDIDSSLIQYEP